MNTSLSLLLGLLILTGCVFEPGNVKVSINRKSSSASSSPKSISSVSVLNNQIKITGTGLEGVTSLKIRNNNLNETFAIESASATQIIAKASHAVSIGVGQIFDLILNSAEGASTFPVSFTLDNESVTAAMLSSMSASPGQILIYNGAAWVPSSVSSSQLYMGTWNASANTPDIDLTSPQAGDYYVVTTAGTHNLVNYAVGDWIISNGSSWSKLSHSSSVVGSFNGRTGLVLPASGDYTWAQINKTSSKLEDIADINIAGRADQKVLKWDGTNSKWIMGDDITGAGAPGPGSITNADLAGGIDQSKITNLTADLASKLGLTSLSATAPLVYNNISGAFSITNATTLLDGAMSAADKMKINGLETLPAANGVLERFSGTLRSNTCADGEVLKWVTLTGWTCSSDSSTDASKQTALTNSAGLAAALSDETGSGLAVFDTAPIINSPDIRGELRLSGSTSGYVGFVPAAIAGATTYKLPATQGTSGQVLTTDGVTSNATLSWVTPATSSISLVGDIGGSAGANAIGNDKVTSTHLLDGTILNVDINNAANIAVTKLGTGAVSTTEFNYLTGVSSSIQTQLSAKEPTIATGAATDYIRGNKTLSVFATDVINSVLSTFSPSALSKPTLANTDSVVGAFNKVQKYLSDIDGDYVSKSASTNNTVSGVVTFNTIGSLNIGYVPTNATDAVSKGYVDGFGQWTKGASGEVYRSTGNVGIGTNSPYSKLSIEGYGIGNGLQLGTRADTANTNSANIYLTDTANGILSIKNGKSGVGYGIIALQEDGGNVGIGTALPANLLSNIDGAASFANVGDSNGTGQNNSSFSWDSGLGGYSASIINSSNVANANGLQVRTAGTIQNILTLGTGIVNGANADVMVVKSNGNVGIGTTSPDSRLMVAAAGNGLSNYTARFQNSGSIAGAGGVLFDQNSIYSYKMHTVGTAAVSGSLVFSLINSTDGSVVNDNNLVLRNGNVGIGTSNPTVKLEVSGGTTKLQQAPWNYPALGSSWVQYGATYGNLAYRLDSMGYLRMRGLIASGLIGGANIIFTLPVGYRPTYTQEFVVASAGSGTANVIVRTNGDVYVETATNTNWVSFDNVSLPLD